LGHTIGFELRVTLFLGLTVAGVVVISAVTFGAYWLFRPEKPGRVK
jgi:hypothetical protein